MVWAMTEVLPELRLVVDWSMVMLIWLVQLVIYPAYRSINPADFAQWHHNYMRTISFMVVPLMFAQAICIGLSFMGGLTAGNILAALALLTAWIATFTLSVPCHNKLQEHGNESEWVDRVVKTNWIRTVAWSIAALAGMIPSNT